MTDHTIFADVRHMLTASVRELAALNAYAFAQTFFNRDARRLTTSEKLHTYDLMRLVELTFKHRELCRFDCTKPAWAVLETALNQFASCVTVENAVNARATADALLSDVFPSPARCVDAFTSSLLSPDELRADKLALLASLKAVLQRLGEGMRAYELAYGGSGLVDDIQGRLDAIDACAKVL